MAEPLFEPLFEPLQSGTWRDHPELEDYRSEWLSSLLVERATWRAGAHPRRIGAVEVAGPGFVWFRFWLPEQDQIVEKYFHEEGHAVGMYMPVCTPLERRGDVYRSTELILGLWMQQSGQVSVLREDEFDAAVADGLLPPVAVERAERRIRELTAAVFRGQFPPPLVRNFDIYVQS